MGKTEILWIEAFSFSFLSFSLVNADYAYYMKTLLNPFAFSFALPSVSLDYLLMHRFDD